METIFILTFRNIISNFNLLYMYSVMRHECIKLVYTTSKLNTLSNLILQYIKLSLVTVQMFSKLNRLAPHMDLKSTICVFQTFNDRQSILAKPKPSSLAALTA